MNFFRGINESMIDRKARAPMMPKLPCFGGGRLSRSSSEAVILILF